MPAALAHARSIYAQRARTMCQALTQAFGEALAFTAPQGGLFIWARLTGANGQPTQAGAFAQRAIEQLVAFVPGAPFFAQAPDAACLRLSFATADEANIVAGVQRMAAAL